jgi:hypothetical protein
LEHAHLPANFVPVYFTFGKAITITNFAWAKDEQKGLSLLVDIFTDPRSPSESITASLLYVCRPDPAPTWVLFPSCTFQLSLVCVPGSTVLILIPGDYNIPLAVDEKSKVFAPVIQSYRDATATFESLYLTFTCANTIPHLEPRSCTLTFTMDVIGYMQDLPQKLNEALTHVRSPYAHFFWIDRNAL